MVTILCSEQGGQYFTTHGEIDGNKDGVLPQLDDRFPEKILPQNARQDREASDFGTFSRQTVGN